MPSPRRFELVEGTHSKFWEVSRRGASLHLRYGRIGADGTSIEKSFSDAAAAQRELDKLVHEKLGKGYAEVGGAVAAPAKASTKASTKAVAPGKKPEAKKSPKGAQAAASPGGWRARFEAMVAELRGNKRITTVKAHLAPPATDAQIAKAERRFGRPIDGEIVGFYREMNGFDLEWESSLSDEDCGHIHIQPIEKTFGDWKDVIWFEHDGGDRFRSLLPFDFFVPEACMAFDATETPLRVHYHYCGEERSATGYGFAEYLERLLASRGYFYWVHALCDEEDEGDSGEAESFLSNVGRLFRGVDKRLFRPKQVDFTSLSLDELIARVKTDEDSEAPKPLAMEIQSRAASAALVRAMLTAPTPEPRIRALKILAHYGLKAMPLLGAILRAQMGLAAGTTKAAESAIADAAKSIFGTINRTVAGGSKKAMAAGAKELEKETDVRAVALLLGSLSHVAADPTGHLFDVSVRSLLDGAHVEAAAKSVCVLNRQDEAAETMLQAPLPTEDAKLVARLTGLAELYGLDDEKAARVRRLLEANLHGRSDEIATTAARWLFFMCEEAEYEGLGLFTHPSPAVREALVHELVAALSCSGRHDMEKRILGAVAKNEQEDARIRDLAQAALA